MAKLKLKIKERKLGKHQAVGLYYEGKRLIEIDPRQCAKKYLNTLIHEILHDRLPKASEGQVSRIAGMITEASWRARFRRIEV